MSDEVFRPGKRKPSNESSINPLDNPFHKLKEVHQAAGEEVGNKATGLPAREAMHPMADAPPIQMSGKVPPEFQKMLNQRNMGNPMAQQDTNFAKQEIARPAMASEAAAPSGRLSPEFESLLSKLNNVTAWEKINLPSKGKFYTDIPGVLHVRPMTGYEEQILTQQRFVKKGQAIDMIFQKCIQEAIQPSKLLAVDRTYLLIYLRAISYTTEYDVEIKCPECSFKFNKVIDLDALELDPCDDNFGVEQLQGKLPTSGFSFKYRLPTGEDDQEVSRHREKRLKAFGEQQDDDTVMHRTALLLDNIEGVSDKQELMHLLKKLPVNDVVHIRNLTNTPPFGVNTIVPMACPSCYSDFDVDLPFEAGFFFPRKKKV